jgi:hypothetical protein
VIRNSPEALVLVDLDHLGVADRALLLPVLVGFLGFESINTVSRPEFPDLSAGQSSRTTQDKFAVEVDFNHGAEVFVIVKLNFFVIGYHPDMALHDFSLEAMHTILLPEFPYLETSESVRRARDLHAVENNINGVTMVVFCRLTRFELGFGF